MGEQLYNPHKNLLIKSYTGPHNHEVLDIAMYFSLLLEELSYESYLITAQVTEANSHP